MVVIVVFVQRTLTTFDVTAPTYVSAQQIIRQPPTEVHQEVDSVCVVAFQERQ